MSDDHDKPSADKPSTNKTGRCFSVQPAVRTRTPLLFGLSGPSGSGKTWSALSLASGMREIVPGPIILIDTENGRAKHYAEDFDFMHVDFSPPFGSQDYLAALKEVSALEPGVIILDSLTHEHDGEGGHLDSYAAELERLAGDDPQLQQRLQLAAWRRPKAARRALLAGLMRLDVHLIACFRAVERTRPAKEGASTDTVEMGFTPIAGQEFVYELTAAALLRPGARGVPTWASDRPGEAMAVKLPRPFEGIFKEGQALSAAHGRAMALWAKGAASAGMRRRGRVRPAPLNGSAGASHL